MRYYIDTLYVMAELLRSKMPSENFYTVLSNSSGNEYILVQSRNSLSSNLTNAKISQKSFNVLVQGLSENKTRQKAYQIYNTLREGYNLSIDVPASKLLDPETASSPNLPTGLVPIRIASIRPISEPYAIGNVGQSLFQYSLNYNLTGRFILDEYRTTGNP